MIFPKSAIQRQVRETFDSTWRDFYATKPASVTTTDDAQLAHAAVHRDEDTMQRLRDFEGGCAGLDAAESSTADVGSATIESSPIARANLIAKASVTGSKTTLHRVSGTPRDGSAILKSDCTRLPQYTFCTYIAKSWLKPEEKTLPFHPTFGENDQFRSEVYEKHFKYRYSWKQPGRDSDGEFASSSLALMGRSGYHSCRNLEAA